MSLERFNFNTFDNNTEDWEYYIQRFEIELQLHGLDGRSPDCNNKRKQLLLSRVGSTAFKILVDYFRPSAVTSKTYDELVKVLHEYYGKKRYVLSERVSFATRYRNENETISQFILQLRSLAGYCEFGNTLEERIRDQLVIGINNIVWQQELIKEHPTNDSKLADVIATLNKLEQAEIQSQRITNTTTIETTAELQAVNKINTRTSKRSVKETPNSSKKCIFCGGNFHQNINECPAKGKRCNACNKLNHFSNVCISSGRLKINKYNTRHIAFKKQSNLNDSENENSGDESIHTCTIKFPNSVSKIMISTELNNKLVEMLYDPGAVRSVIGKRLWETIGRPSLKTCKNLVAYTDVKIETLGVCDISVKAFNTVKVLSAYVTQHNDLPLFGLDWCLQFNLPMPPGARLCNIKEPTTKTKSDMNTKDSYEIDLILKDFETLCDGKLGTINCHSAKIHIPSNIRPKAFRPRPVPLALQEQVNEELKRLVREGVLEQIDTMATPIEWASPIVIAIKSNGNVRICADFKVTINQYVQVDDYPLPRFEEITSKLAGGQLFTKIDLKDAYLQLLVHPESRRYLTISTHKGYFQYKRLPFGISFAPAVFQRIMHQILSGLDGVVCYLDDILITAGTRQEHIKRVRTVLQRLQEAGIKSQISKCSWLQESVTFLGHKIDKNGLHPTSERVEAIKKMPTPTNVAELRSFLGSITYYGRFIDNLHVRCAPLYRHLKKNQKWEWTIEDTQITNDLKNTLTSNETLAHYDESKPIYVSSDASDKGVGAVLFHKIDNTMRPVAFASRTLSETERRYSTIDKEALGIVYSVTKFHQYLYGRKFTFLTDHKPLERIFSQDRETPKIASNRLLRWAMILNSYEYTINYHSAKENSPADVLSRLPLPNCDTTIEERIGLPKFSHLLHLRLSNIPVTKHELRKETRSDTNLNKIKQYLTNHWPEKKELSNDMHTYYEKREQMSFEDGIILWNGRLCIPKKLQPAMLEMLHDGHNGVNAMQSLARLHVYWPNIDKDIQNFLKRCTLCQASRSNTNAAPVYPWGVPPEPWYRLHIDFAGPFFGYMWLIVIDAYTKWLEIIPMKSTTSRSTISHLDTIFATFGVPKYIVTDNGPQFISDEFKTHCQNIGITHIRTTPYHPRTNGLAERAVRTFKERLLASDKSIDLHERLSRILQAYRNTTRRSTNRTPFEAMFGRPMRTTFDLLKPNIQDDLERMRLYKEIRPTQKVVVPPTYKHGDKVWVNKPTGKGSDAGIIIKCNGPYSYEVQFSNGVQQRKHSDHLRPRLSSSQDGIPAYTHYQRITDREARLQHSGDCGRQSSPVPSTSRQHPEGSTPHDGIFVATSASRNDEITPTDPRPQLLRRSLRQRKIPARYGF
ncbi:uncharacterized protein K02A2.6-like [Galleria mellonella]|uniref:RNA-directed DNA polymerase n=1 Tax=Galleria mellonella TaxID=7137 RepID=A0ABM3MNZ9_GALME|nr:uncharacterized protein K02A2.6-like [Galleria mellonella]